MMALQNRSMDDTGTDQRRPPSPAPFSKQSQGEQVDQSRVQMVFEYLQRWRHSFVVKNVS